MGCIKFFEILKNQFFPKSSNNECTFYCLLLRMVIIFPYFCKFAVFSYGPKSVQQGCQEKYSQKASRMNIFLPSCTMDDQNHTSNLIFMYTYRKRGEIRRKELASKFLWPMEPPVWTNLFLTWHRDYFPPLVSNITIFFGITLHYNAFMTFSSLESF